MTNTSLNNSTLQNEALLLDKEDPLKVFRDQFYIPDGANKKQAIYLCGNSLGLQPKSTKEYINEELDAWAKLGVEGHMEGKHPWLPYHEFLTPKMAKIVGAKEEEVVVMNSLSVNLHLMMVSFYRPSGKKCKIMIESDAFPSDKYAVQSQIHFHGGNPDEDMIELYPRAEEVCLRTEDILQSIEENKEELALVMIGNTNYYTGQFFDMKRITEFCHKHNILVGFDCAHGAGNVDLDLHNSGADFAMWCSYKYLNSGPGSLSGCYVHERHLKDENLPKFKGWWGHNKKTRFKMRDAFEGIPTVESWQLSNPPILSMAAIRASLDLFDQAGMNNLLAKSKKLTGFMEKIILGINHPKINIITPSDPNQRGCQLSIQVVEADKTLFDKITADGVIADWREPDVIRVAPVPLYNSFQDVLSFCQILEKNLSD